MGRVGRGEEVWAAEYEVWAECLQRSHSHNIVGSDLGLGWHPATLSWPDYCYWPRCLGQGSLSCVVRGGHWPDHLTNSDKWHRSDTISSFTKLQRKTHCQRLPFRDADVNHNRYIIYNHYLCPVTFFVTSNFVMQKFVYFKIFWKVFSWKILLPWCMHVFHFTGHS